MLLFGCAGSQGAPSAGQAQPAAGVQKTTPAPATNPDSAATSPPAAEPNAAPVVSNSAASSGTSFADLMGMRSNLKWRVDYDLTTSASGATAIQMTQYVKGSNIRTDTAAGGQSIRTYILGDKYYTCMQQGAWTCFVIQMSATDAQSKVESEPSKYASVPDGTMQIAGVSTSCFKLDNVEGAAMRYCFSQDGVPLYFSVTSTSDGQKMDTIMSATGYTTAVSDADFVLPAAAQEMPSYGG